MATKPKIQLALWVLLFMVAIPISAYGADGQIKITQPDTFPITITNPGSYVLTSNIEVSAIGANGIEIQCDDVTLDLNGHALIGPGKTSSDDGSGIDASGQRNITIINGTVRDFGKHGIELTDPDSGNREVKDIKAYSNGSHGIISTNSTVTNCTADSNDSRGIFATNSTITNCTANYNSLTGIYGASSAVTNCTARGNTTYGIHGTDSTLTNCKATANPGDGIFARNSTVTNCTANYNTSDGINAARSTVTNCTANWNTGEFSDGIETSEKCRIEGNNLRYNGGYGLHLSDNHNYAIKNVASNNSVGNFHSAGTDNHMPTTGDNANHGF